MAAATLPADRAVKVAFSPDGSKPELSANGDSSAPSRSRPGRLASLFKPLVGVGVAASVAVVAVLSLQSIREVDPAAAPVVASAPVRDEYIRAARAPQFAADTGIARELDVYLVNHNEYAASRGKTC